MEVLEITVNTEVEYEKMQESKCNLKNKKYKSKKERILWLDILRGIAMFLVVYGHTSQNAEIKKYIYAFHMPLFFIISGMTNVFEKEVSTKEFIKKKVKSLIIPYILLNLLMFPLTYINGNIGAVKRFSIGEYIIGILYSNNLGSYDAPANATWFITTLFLTELIFFFMKKYLKNDKELLLASIIMGIIGYSNSISKYKYNGPWHIQVVFTAIVFYFIGYIFMKNIEKIQLLFNKKIKTLICCIILLLVGIGFTKMNTRVSLTADKYGSFIYFYIAALTISASITIFTMKFLNRKLLITKYIGQNCILWIAAQIPIIRYIQKIMPIVKKEEIYALALAVIVYLAIIPLSMIINRFLPFLVGKFSKYNLRKDKYRIIAIIILMVLIFGGGYYIDNMNVIKYKQVIKKENYVAHALGGIDGFGYTNSKEALENSYNNGFRIFEADVKLTSDKKLVCVHGWSKKDYEERLGIQYNKEKAIMDYDTFMSLKIQGKYTPLSFKDLAKFIEEHQDMYVMIDIGSKSYEDTKEVYTKIVEDCNNNDKVLQRLIVGGHTTKMIKAVKECYDFDIINLYWPEKSKREEKINTKSKFAEYCKQNGITSVSLPVDRYTEDFGKYMQKNNIIVYAFTENEESKAKNILESADLVGTDFIQVSK